MIEMFMLFFLSMFNYMYFSSSSLTKKAISFIIMVVISILILPLWAGVLLMLLYIGGLFIVLTYIITFSFFQEKMTFLTMGSLIIIFSLSFYPGKMETLSFFMFEPMFESTWVMFPLMILVLGLIIISTVTPSGKSVRGGF